MKKRLGVLILFMIVSSALAVDFTRNLPNENMQKALTPENFKNMDAVIILKEQSFVIQDKEIERLNIRYKGSSISKSGIIIVKLFNEMGVKRYGTFEYEYPEYFGNIFPNVFQAKVRVLKPDQTIWTMDEDEVNIEVTHTTASGEPLARKALFKIPNLATDDILQIEYSCTENFSWSNSGIFYYNDRDFILYSNLYVTLPSKWDARYISFSEKAIGPPKIQQVSKQFGSGKTYFWSVRNLNGIPDEAYSFPFSEQSLMTAFLVERTSPNSKEYGNWENIAENFYEAHIKKGDIDNSNIEELGFSKNQQKLRMNFNIIDSLYLSLRQNITLKKKNSIYPLANEISSVFKTGKGDASDLAYIMYKILKKWDQSVNIVWVRDKREGKFEFSVPTINWFDRLGVLVGIDGKEKLYDFDRSISNNYRDPWYLANTDVIVIQKDGYVRKTISTNSTLNENQKVECHHLKFDSLASYVDHVQVAYCGAFANQFRKNHYDREKTEIEKSISGKLRNECLSSIQHIEYNDFLNSDTVSVYADGFSAIKMDTLDSYLTLRLENYLLNDFKADFNNSNRRGHINFKFPFELRMEWAIEIPKGYTLKSELLNEIVNGPLDLKSYCQFVNKDNQLKITSRVLFPSTQIPVNYYSNIVDLLNKTSAVLNRDIIFEKI